ncbi:DUF6502 family protein [Yoonia sp. SS1-5]|uniref:DUF6502 family protein n=1 Tax=Yoonia rhodophyticola TaxID=3137370 RepID=A0AAN0MAS7_9RHOB
MRLILRPIARLMIANNLPLSRFVELAKRALIEEALAQQQSATNSYVSLKTGVHRKDVKRLREMDDWDSDPSSVATPIASILTCWTQDPAFCQTQGQARPLRRRRDGENAGFEDLVRRAKVDVPAATILQELVDQKLVRTNEDEQILLISDTYIPTMGAAVLEAFQATVTDHVSVAVDNAISDDPADKAFDRVLRYSHLSQASVEELDAASRAAALDYLNKLNSLAHDLQTRDAESEPQETGRFVTGVYIVPKHPQPVPSQKEKQI